VNEQIIKEWYKTHAGIDLAAKYLELLTNQQKLV
jgi:hypothetical protein